MGSTAYLRIACIRRFKLDVEDGSGDGVLQIRLGTWYYLALVLVLRSIRSDEEHTPDNWSRR